MQTSSELSTIITAWFESVAKGDPSWIDRYMSRKAGVRLVGTDPKEWLAGEKAAEFLKGEVQAMGGVIKATIGEVEAYQEGSVGWGVARPTLTLPDGKQVFPRWSAVFHQENGDWKLVQLHASVGISNEQLLGMELPS
ncbi:MAG: nuclear transport factor 2 family protein [Nitrospira sp.]|nr:nuclear transport factor 2 family protein [Nitrospira sp.]